MPRMGDGPTNLYEGRIATFWRIRLTILLQADRNVGFGFFRLAGRPWELLLLSVNPKKKEVDYLFFLFRRERAVEWHLPPFVQTSPAAHGARVHGNEDRMTTHWRLAPVMQRGCRCQALVDKIACVPAQGVRTDRLEVGNLLCSESKGTPEPATRKSRQSLLGRHSCFNASREPSE